MSAATSIIIKCIPLFADTKIIMNIFAPKYNSN